MNHGNITCPICHSTKNVSLSIGLHLCKHCKIVFNSNYKPAAYNENYFIDDYKTQYGKTYIDDFEYIYKMSQARINKIISFLKKSPGNNELSLLDIGSALGFFLKCAEDMGIKKILGIEISKYACDYTRDKLNINVINDSFIHSDIRESFDIISAWFFIEHCMDPLSIMKKIFNSLNAGGIFAFSTPSIFGPVYLLNRENWINTHPDDHSIDFSPKSLKNILKGIGFRNIYIFPSGFHPERIFSKNSFLFKPFSFFYRHVSRLINFSDTVEVYALK